MKSKFDRTDRSNFLQDEATRVNSTATTRKKARPFQPRRLSRRCILGGGDVSPSEELMSDILYGLRQIERNLSLTILSIAVLGMGIGAPTAVFAALYDVVLKPLPYREASRLVYPKWP